MILGVMEGSQKTGIFLAGSCRISRSPSEREREREREQEEEIMSLKTRTRLKWWLFSAEANGKKAEQQLKKAVKGLHFPF